ncbi:MULTISPECIES: alpha/beta fold hydrolase [unclassified Leifsonia]|uniref:alpha/beta fold hydrolase n=1 Tax=unclassified Leifsonia TaxID=2663824 RepID=UPI0006FBAB6D|nr:MULTISPECIES: alpha/beta hydrolase [unclassified Leifsonia]KQX05220.1 alpha/beta hydrolase [Leifsonia sp. Root1293]KRA08853.1 alpha/beta hydrolase [Leifsonia sp. Root60]
MRTATVTTPVLDIAYEESGDPGGRVVVLMHGFPYDVRAYDGVVARLTAAGVRVIVPWLRGYGGTRFRSAETLRSGQQGALGSDLLDLLDGLGIEKAVVGGYDWGGRAACIVAALHPERISGLVTVGGYNVQDLAAGAEAGPHEFEPTFWYKFFLHSEWGRGGLERNREAFCLRLWELWSPTWTGASAAFPASAPSFANPDFVDVVVHSYRHRSGLAAGDPRYDDVEARLARMPQISVPTISLDSGADGIVGDDDSRADLPHFSGPFERILLPGIGHNVPQEAPAAFAEAVLSLL